MFLGILALLISFCISIIAIYFSVTGWVALFSGAALGVSLMFGSIEIGKLIAAGFLHWHWKKLPWVHRYVLLSMVLITMLLTSVGVFGFLSKAHLDQELPTGTAELQIERIDQQLSIEQRKINDANYKLNELQAIIDTLIEYDKISGPNGARSVRTNQDPERQFLQKEIESAFVIIDSLQDKKLKYKYQVNEVKAKLGPLTYVVDLFNFENKDFAVQLVILFSIFVFDPFAIALLLAGLWSFKHNIPEEKIVPLNTSNVAKIIIEDLEEIEEVIEDPLAMSEEQKNEMEKITLDIHREAKEYLDVQKESLDSEQKTSKIKNIKEIKEMLAQQPELVQEVQKKLQEDDPELAQEMEETFNQFINENSIRKSGFLDNIFTKK